MSNERRASKPMAWGTNCEGGFGRASVPNAYLMAISQELAAERYSSAALEESRLRAFGFSLCSAPRLHRKMLVSSRYFMLSFSTASFSLQKQPGVLPAGKRQSRQG